MADEFKKRHDNVLRSYDQCECSPEFNALNFEAVVYTDEKGEERRMVRMTRDGFMFLVMGFTGKEAAQWQERFHPPLEKLAQAATTTFQRTATHRNS